MLVDLPRQARSRSRAAELTLALLLFTDASTIGLVEAGRYGLAAGPPARDSHCLSRLSSAHSSGLLLFPALGGRVRTADGVDPGADRRRAQPARSCSTRIPVRVRRAINIESGLNDGIATPFVALFLAVALAEEIDPVAGNWVVEAGREIALAVVVALVVGGGRGLAGWSEGAAHDWASPASEALAVVALAILAYAGRDGHRRERLRGCLRGRHHLPDGDRAARSRRSNSPESVGVAASYLVWLLFGVALAGPVLAAGLDPVVIAYAVPQPDHRAHGAGRAAAPSVAPFGRTRSR